MYDIRIAYVKASTYSTWEVLGASSPKIRIRYNSAFIVIEECTTELEYKETVRTYHYPIPSDAPDFLVRDLLSSADLLHSKDYDSAVKALERATATITVQMLSEWIQGELDATSIRDMTRKLHCKGVEHIVPNVKTRGSFLRDACTIKGKDYIMEITSDSFEFFYTVRMPEGYLGFRSDNLLEATPFCRKLLLWKPPKLISDLESLDFMELRRFLEKRGLTSRRLPWMDKIPGYWR